jgi:hypothetical protein
MPARIIAVALAAALAIFGISRVRKHRNANRAVEPTLESNSSRPVAENVPTLTPTS